MPVNDNAQERDCCFTIKAGAERGFAVYEEAVLIGAFSTAADLAHWIETRLAPLDPPQLDAEPMPQMLQSAKPARVGWRK